MQFITQYLISFVCIGVNCVNSTLFGWDACEVNTDCPAFSVCVDGWCQNACEGVCGVNAVCQVVGDRSPVCSCKPQYTGDPKQSCQLKEGRCEVDSHCALDEACSNEICQHACIGACGANSECIVKNHHPVCSCKPGFLSSAKSGCLSPFNLWWERNHWFICTIIFLFGCSLLMLGGSFGLLIPLILICILYLFKMQSLELYELYSILIDLILVHYGRLCDIFNTQIYDLISS